MNSLTSSNLVTPVLLELTRSITPNLQSISTMTFQDDRLLATLEGVPEGGRQPLHQSKLILVGIILVLFDKTKHKSVFD